MTIHKWEELDGKIINGVTINVFPNYFKLIRNETETLLFVRYFYNPYIYSYFKSWGVDVKLIKKEDGVTV